MKKLLGVFVVAIGPVVAVVLPSLRRYLKMERM